VQYVSFKRHPHDQQPAEPPVAIQKRVNRLKQHMGEERAPPGGRHA
jgi:hypothetical protein